jgi:hypothetical protein
MTKLKLSIAHQVPGRIRMKIASAKGNPELLRQISETFAAIPGIEQITVNPATGCVVVHYDADQHEEFHGRFRHHYNRVLPDDWAPPKTEIDDLASKLTAEAEFLARNSQSARAIVDFFKHVDREIKVATNNTIDLKIVFAIGMLAIAHRWRRDIRWRGRSSPG